MGGLSIWHLLILAGIVLLVMGPSRLPGLGRSLGEAIRGFKKGLGGDEIDVTDSVPRDQIPENQGPGEPSVRTGQTKQESTKTPS